MTIKYQPIIFTRKVSYDNSTEGHDCEPFVFINQYNYINEKESQSELLLRRFGLTQRRGIFYTRPKRLFDLEDPNLINCNEFHIDYKASEYNRNAF